MKPIVRLDVMRHVALDLADAGRDGASVMSTAERVSCRKVRKDAMKS